jgi:ATP-binding cassette, subfamily A (ABC1), member 3
MVSGDVKPDAGDVLINGVSVVRQPRVARLSLGVCPQFTAIDSQLTVREHLMIYGRLKGLRLNALRRDVESLMRAIKLTHYAERLASKLSGGNQRKLSLAIAIIGEFISYLGNRRLTMRLGNPSVLLIDEFSTGVDPKMKREMWETLRTVTVAAGKAVVITTRTHILFTIGTMKLTRLIDSMEEAMALSSKVGILAKRMLGTYDAGELHLEFPMTDL